MTHRASIAALLLGAQVLTGCTSWQVQSVTPQQLIAREHPKAIQVRERGGPRYVIQTPRAEGDSLIGTVIEHSRGGSIRLEQRRAVSLMAVDRVAVRRFSAAKTLGAVVVPLVAIAVACAAYAAGGDNCSR